MFAFFVVEGKKAEAEEFLKQAKRDFPNNSAGYRMLGDFYSLAGELDKAVAEYGILNQEHPKDLSVKKNYIQLLMQNHRYDEARKLDDEVLKANPNDQDALMFRGELEMQASDANGAAKTFQTAVKNDPKDAIAHYQLGVAYQKLGNLENADSEWRDAVRLRPNMVEAQRSLALLAMRKGDMSTLEQAAAQLIILKPASPEGYALHAVSETNSKQFKAAEEDIQKAMQVDPHSHLAWVQLGDLKLVQKQYNEAGKAFQQALDRDPNSTDALRGLANTYLVQNQVDKAITVANAQIAKAPGNSSFYDLLGTVLFHNKKDLDGAEAAFNKAIALDANNPDATANLIQVQSAKGQLDRAITSCQQEIKSYPHNVGFFILLGNLYVAKSDVDGRQQRLS